MSSVKAHLERGQRYSWPSTSLQQALVEKEHEKGWLAFQGEVMQKTSLIKRAIVIPRHGTYDCLRNN